MGLVGLATLVVVIRAMMHARPWAPAYADYLFLAFTTARAFSPTDTVPLTARAKMLMMIQALLSLVTIVIVAARAVGRLGP
jgi:hypothetical protein